MTRIGVHDLGFVKTIAIPLSTTLVSDQTRLLKDAKAQQKRNKTGIRTLMMFTCTFTDLKNVARSGVMINSIFISAEKLKI